MLKIESPGACGATGTFGSVCLAANRPEDNRVRLLLQVRAEIIGRLKLCKRRVVVWVGAV